MSLAIFTLIHVLISLAGIGTGFAVVGGWLGGKHLPRWTAWFLATTALTSLTGFFFPFKGFTPPYAFAVLSLLVLAVAGYALYSRRLAGPWRKTYVICGVAALYLNFFVARAASTRPDGHGAGFWHYAGDCAAAFPRARPDGPPEVSHDERLRLAGPAGSGLHSRSDE
jgi:hypothetical protein